MKRILSIFLALVLALGALPTAAFAADETIVASGDDGSIHWVLDDQGTLTVSGQGRVPNYYSGSGAPWKAGDLKAQIKKLVVEEGITYLGQFAFSDCVNLTAVSLPSTLEEIGQQVFQRCSGLLSVDIPDSVHAIGKWPFEGCTSLQSAHLPAGIGTHSDVSKRILPEGLFNGCTSLAAVNVPDGVTVIGPLAFCNCAALESIDLPNTVTSLGSNAFSGTGLRSLILPDNITTIGEYALLGNTQLTTLKLPANLETLGNNVLNDSAVTELTIPGGVKVVGADRQGLFAPAPNLEKLVFEDGVETIKGSFLQAVNLKEIHIPASVTSIADGVFVILHPDCVIYGEPGSYAETYAAQQNIPFNGQPVPGHTLALTVQDENGQPLDSGYTVTWYAGGVQAGTGTRLTVTDTTVPYSYELTLDEPLLYSYSQPQRQDVTLAQEGDTTAITAALSPLPELTVTGRVLTADGGPAQGAQAVFTQDFGGGHTQALTAAASADGSFAAQIKDVPTHVLVSAPGFYNKSLTVSAAAGANLGDITLTPLPSSRITLSLLSAAPALPGQTPEETALTSDQGLTFTVTDGNGAPVSGFAVQYPYILFETALTAGTVLTVTAADAAGATASAAVTLDGKGCGEAALRFLQQGKFTVRLESNAPTTLLLFDAGGSLLQAVDTEGQYTSRSLSAGTYQAALLRRNGLLKSVPSLAALSSLGLAAGTDYALTGSFTVVNGVITDLGSVTVPALDEAKLAYTDPERTGTTVNYATAAVGKLITLRAEYALKPEHAGAASGLAVTVELPQGLTMQGAATVDGKAVAVSQDSQAVTIPVTGTSGVVRFCFLAGQPGDYHIPAYLHFTENGVSVTQPLGSARLTVTAAQLYVPAVTGSQSVTASGLAQAGSTVNVYDNGTQMGTAAANAAGRWSLTYTLDNSSGYTYHDVYAQVQAGGISYRTETAQMLYDAAYVGVSKVTMYNTAEGVECETVFDYLHPNRGLGYYVMQRSQFSFVIEFTENTDRISDVKLNVFAEDGGVYTYDTTYDPQTGRYLADVSGVVPVNVGVEYLCASDGSVQYSGMSPDDVRSYLSQASEAVEDLLVPVDAGTVSGDTGYVTMGLEGSDETFHILLTPLDYSDFPREVLNERNFLSDEDTGLWYVLSIDEDTAEFIIVDPTKHSAFSIGAAYDLPVQAAEAPAMLLTAAEASSMLRVNPSNTIPLNQRIATDLLEKLPLPLLPSATAALDLQDLSIILERKHTEMWETYFSLKELLDKYLYASCPGSMQLRMSQEDATRAIHMLSNLRQNEDYRYRYWQSMLNNVYSSKIRNALVMDVLTSGLAKAVSKIPNVLSEGQLRKLPDFWQKQVSTLNLLKLSEPMTDLADNFYAYFDAWGDGFNDLAGYDLPTQSGFWDFTDVNGSPYYLNMLDAYDNGMLEASTLQNFILQAISKCPEDPTPEDPEGKDKSPENDKAVKRDPSGFVCEAVASNRLEGVTATLYYRAGDGAEPVQWDGTDYGEANPLTTDANGVYRWDVPAGLWQVKYEKDGYTSAQSEWLPVPPPQTEVNVALVSTESPAVQSVTAYPDGVRIAFSQYLKPDSVTANTVTVLCGGKAVDGTIAPVNAEAGFTDPENQYASVYLFTPSEPLSQAVTVQVQGVKSYNGKGLAADYEAETPVTLRPTGLTAPETADAALGGETLLTVRLQPAEAAAGKVLRVTSDLPSVIAPAQGTITFGQDGTASVMVSGKLLGTATVTFTLEGSDLPAVSTTVTSAVSAGETRCAAVQGSIPSGSTVAAGTALTLTTATEGASIYYTLDKTCPCITDNPGRMLYTGPIVLTEDVFLIAYAVKEGLEDSPTAKFDLRVTSSPAPVIPPVVGPAQPAQPTQPDPWTNPYADVSPEAWYYDHVACVTQRGLMTGVAAGRFAPDGDTTRAMIWTILGRMAGTAVDGGTPWYDAARTWAMDAGVSDGTNALDRIRRQELAAMLYRFAGSPAVTDSQLALLHSFPDEDSVSAYARDAMAWAVSTGIINGVDGRLAPMGFATRAQTAAMLTRFCLLLDNKRL